MAELSEQAKSTLARISIIRENMEKRLAVTESDISEERMWNIEYSLRFAADWLYKAYREI